MCVQEDITLKVGGGKHHEGLIMVHNKIRETAILSALSTLAVVMKLFTSKN
jgi:hypothetical protein